MKRLLTHVGLLALAACVATDAVDLENLRPGLFVAATGDAADDAFRVSKLELEARDGSDKADKVEVTAPVRAADGASVAALGLQASLDAESEYESLDKQPVEPFVPSPGEWVRLKLRNKEEGHRVRTLRRSEPRDRFQVVGELLGVDPIGRVVDIGGVRLPMAPDAELDVSQQGADDPLALFFGDDQKTVPLDVVLTDSLRLGGQIAGEYEENREFDFDAADPGDRTKRSLGGRLDLLWSIDDRGSYALGEVSFGRADRLRDGGATTTRDRLELTRGFVSLRLGDHFQLLAGRQDFDEGREWLYDEVLDGVRGVFRWGALRAECAVAKGREGMAEPSVERDWGLMLGKLAWLPAEDWTVTAYAMQRRDDSVVDFEPRYFGVQSHHEPRYGLGHWLEAGVARGSAGAKAVRGHAVDVGLQYTLDVPWRPAVAVGYALGSGRADTATSIGYRQSGFQDNTGKLGGVTSVRYYGELLDPELSNLSVTTLSFAVRPLRNASVSVLLHGYRQDVASTSLVDTSLRISPNGRSRDLGHELDLVLAYRIARRVTVEFVAGRYEPGDAFATRDAATLFVLTTRFSF